MRMPNPGTSPRRLIRFFGLYLLARLGVHPETVPLAAVWRRAVDTLKAALGVSDAAVERQVAARAVLDFADEALDDRVRAVAAAAKADLGGRAEGADWNRLFPVLPGEVVVLPIGREAEEVKRIEAELAGGAMWTSARTHLAALAAARQALERANAEYHAAVQAWRSEYRAIYGSLMERLRGNTPVVDLFFWRRDEAAQAGEEEPKAASA